MKDPITSLRFLGFQARADGGRRFNFSFFGSDSLLHLISVEAAHHLFGAPSRMSIQESASICYETLKSCMMLNSRDIPTSIDLTSSDIERHRKHPKTRGRPAVQ